MSEHCPGAARNMWLEKELTDADILFGKEEVPDEELEACWTYELARESQTLRLILTNGWHREQPRFLPDDASLFLGGKTTVEDLRAMRPIRQVCRPKGSFNSRLKWRGGISQSGCLCWNGNAREDYLQSTSEGLRQKRRQKLEPAWIELSPIERKRFEESNRAVEWYDSGSELSSDPYLLSKSYQELPTGRMAKCPSLRAIRKGPLNLWNPKHADTTITTYDGEWVCLFIPWRDKTDDELGEIFKQWAKDNRPKGFSQSADREASGGWGKDELQTRQRLHRLGVCRLFTKYRNRAHVKPEWKNRWGMNATRMRKDCQELADLFHQRFPFLSPDEKPDCLALCAEEATIRRESQGRTPDGRRSPCLSTVKFQCTALCRPLAPRAGESKCWCILTPPRRIA